MSTTPKRALIIVDLQPDFLPGGPLGVPEGDAIVEPVLALLRHYDTVVATQDWHPADHGSFAANHPGRSVGELTELGGLEQILWPTHCVQGSPGAELAPALQAERERLDAIFKKGTDPGIDSYSGFFDNGKRKATGLGDWLLAREIEELAICGLALDYCVKFTALDALELGFRTRLVRDGTRAVNLEPGDDERAFAAIREAGGEVVDSASLLREVAGA